MEYLSDNLTKVKQYFYEKDENDTDKKETETDTEIQEDDAPKKRKKTVIVPFWSENPNVLFQREYSMEFFPIDSMSYEQKLNAVTRTVLVLTIIGLIISQSPRIVIVSAITIFAIFILHYYHQKEKDKNASKKLGATQENFENPTMDYLNGENVNIPSDLFSHPDSSNPFSNVLISDYEYNPEKKPQRVQFIPT